jgi:hypothetical protein
LRLVFVLSFLIAYLFSRRSHMPETVAQWMGVGVGAVNMLLTALLLICMELVDRRQQQQYIALLPAAAVVDQQYYTGDEVWGSKWN